MNGTAAAIDLRRSDTNRLAFDLRHLRTSLSSSSRPRHCLGERDLGAFVALGTRLYNNSFNR
ncbi:MAG TPA: hypothetical protein VHY33_13945 [Thermoanaerobaculia bacterium]|jgi:hypothetical protein|nr:hypothetical protein [Thermoanaerobaculia bacterium]